ncbi:hypothetical protein [Pedobacter sp. SL55]|uniref:hypothetical protein n=1 Tax=Pedobacter sp. SL55 TaxID=2995161 RepID=UPI00226F2D73|nr:hypothetical protein [Pedobacter sp. SL55]WAC39813.1 hypothetical protein OVA16_14675 [Pedobacter sp. SL55]
MNITGNTKGGKDPQKTDKNIKPLNSVKEDIEDGNIKPVKNTQPAKQREQSEQPVHSVKKAPKE